MGIIIKLVYLNNSLNPDFNKSGAPTSLIVLRVMWLITLASGLG